MARSYIPIQGFDLCIALFLVVAACGGSDGGSDLGGDPQNGGGKNGNGTGDGDDPGDNPGGFGNDSDAGGGGGGVALEGDPVDCAQAASTHSYVGCDYWPTITPNGVPSGNFKFVAAVANTGKTDAAITVTGPNGFNTTKTVAAGALAKIELPWISSLKGPDFVGTSPQSTTANVTQGGAYHLVSSSPVIVYQFNPLEFKSGSAASYSNDASLLLPSTAMTGNYRVTGMRGWVNPGFFGLGAINLASILTITATAPNTHVKMRLGAKAKMVSAGSIPAAAGGSVVEFDLANAGDVAQLQTPAKDDMAEDFSGSVIEASAPIQVITSVPCINLPKDKAACDHIEETVLPAEALGKKYVIAPPTGFDGTVAAQTVRLYGNRDGTSLTYSPSKPAGCPDTLSAGQIADCGIVGDGFVVEGTNEFAAMTFLLGASYYPASNPDAMGDPSQTSYPAVEQFRKNYIFLAPTTYPVLYADVTAPQGATLTLDGAPATATWQQIGTSGYGVFRLDLTKSGNDGVHTLESSVPVGVQVLGYGRNTTFQYPAGLNLTIIAPPPPPVVN